MADLNASETLSDETLKDDKIKFKVYVCPVENPEQAKKVIEIEIKQRVFFSKSWRQRHNIPN